MKKKNNKTKDININLLETQLAAAQLRAKLDLIVDPAEHSLCSNGTPAPLLSAHFIGQHSVESSKQYVQAVVPLLLEVKTDLPLHLAVSAGVFFLLVLPHNPHDVSAEQLP